MSRWVLAEFTSPKDVLAAARAVRAAGEREVDTYSAFPLHGADEALGLKRSRVPVLALAGGLFGAVAGYGVQWFCNAYDFPINVGNRPPHAAPAFIPITFETLVLAAAFSIFFGLMFLARLPQPYHPVFRAEAFRSVGVDRFWLSVVTDADLSGRLQGLGATRVEVVEGTDR